MEKFVFPQVLIDAAEKAVKNDVAHESLNAPVPFKTAYGVVGATPKRVQFVPTPVKEGERRGAVQAFKDQCDINRIMAKYQLTGSIEWIQKHEGQFGDVTGMSFQNAMDQVLRAEEMFNDLPSTVRKRFGNDPGAFFDFMHDSGNSEEMVKLGLAVKRPDPEPLAPVAPAPAS